MLKTGDLAIAGPTKTDGDKHLRRLSQEMGTKCESRRKFFIKQVALVKNKKFLMGKIFIENLSKYHGFTIITSSKKNM